MNGTSVNELECEAWDFYDDQGVRAVERKEFVKTLYTIMKTKRYVFNGRTESVVRLIEECNELGLNAASAYFDSRVIETPPYMEIRKL